MPHVLFLWLLVSPQSPHEPCDNPGLAITQKKRVVFELTRWLLPAPAPGVRVTLEGDVVRIRPPNASPRALRLPGPPRKALRRNNLVILALGDHGILFLDVRDPDRPQPVLQRILERTVDGFELLGEELVPTSGGRPIEEIVTRVVTCDGPRQAPHTPDSPAAPDPAEPPVLDEGALPETPPEILLTKWKRPTAETPLHAGATELALFTTARTLPRGATLVEAAVFGIPQGLPEAWVDVVGVKVGLTERSQFGLRTSLRLLTVAIDNPLELLAAGIVGLSYKYQIYREGEHSLAFNYVFPYTELVWSRHHADGSFTLAAGTSLLSLFAVDDHRDVFLRAGFACRLALGLHLLLEAGVFQVLEDPETLGFGSVGLRLGDGGSPYLDAFLGVLGEPGQGHGVFAGLALGWQH